MGTKLIGSLRNASEQVVGREFSRGCGQGLQGEMGTPRQVREAEAARVGGAGRWWRIARDCPIALAPAVRGEHPARIARLLDPVRGLITEDALSTDLQQAREAFESLLAHVEPPPGTHVRPVTAGGVQSLVVSTGEDTRPTVLYLHGGGYIVGSAFGYRSHAGALALAAQTGCWFRIIGWRPSIHFRRHSKTPCARING